MRDFSYSVLFSDYMRRSGGADFERLLSDQVKLQSAFTISTTFVFSQ